MLENTFLYPPLMSKINVSSSCGYKKVVRSIFLHSSLPLIFTLQCQSRNQIFTLLLSHHLDRNPINFGKHAMLRWGAPIIAKAGKGKQPLPASSLNQAEREPRSSASRSLAVTGVLGSHSTAEPEKRSLRTEDCSSSESYGRIWRSDIVSYDSLWRRNCWTPMEGAY